MYLAGYEISKEIKISSNIMSISFERANGLHVKQVNRQGNVIYHKCNAEV